MTSLTKYSWLTSAVILSIGFLFLHFGLVNYGTTFFFIFPLAVGFALGTHPKEQRSWLSLSLAAILFFGFLLAGQLEGLICVAMALPIFLLAMWIGYLIRKVTSVRKTKRTQDHLVVSVMPLVVLLALDPIEQMILPEPEVVTITTSVLLDYPAELVFDQVKAMDKLDAEKPLGIRLGLPSPYRCVLEADTIGAKRHCLFENGSIIAEITRYEKGEVLEMDVVDYSLTGREWFRFVDATYTFARENGQTKITRTSSYKSLLNPRIYWEPLEGWGIEQEHQFVLASLRKNLEEFTAGQ
ncbi:polyketide cyclase [Neolewinella aurantiaca]|uniref:Polyketide cyclase n=1 Tax=Neolewinella aurantiaca TaxID=2602767 RepID=A0A5C7FMD6_9BACT|nr:polyketide cyclase [Neolewinella aurantiaca]TXF91230.1 polyketide cyclase [Neolewinella aurantiaca]